MLSHQFSAGQRSGAYAHVIGPAGQNGVVLLISLIILVALTIGGIALVRSVDTTNIISGNLAFQQAATHEGEAGTAQAVLFLESIAYPYTELHTDDASNGYTASTPSGVWAAAGDAAGNPADWDAYWSTVIDPVPRSLPVTAASCGLGGGRACTLATNPFSGNTVSYTIQRLCAASGDPLLLPTGCARGSQSSSQIGTCLGSGCIPLPKISQYYYRITTRVVGPRNTTSYIQTIVAR